MLLRYLNSLVNILFIHTIPSTTFASGIGGSGTPGSSSGSSTSGIQNAFYSYGVINAKALFGTSLVPEAKLRLYNEDGQLYEVSLDKSVSINGVDYPCSTKEEMQAVLAEIPLNSFAKIYGRNDKVTSVLFDNTSDSYTNLTYDTETKQFSNISTEASSLPIYYGDFENITAPYLDENHKYNIDLYDYGVHITKMTAINANNTVERIDVNFAMNSNFLQNIFVYCETTDENSMIKAELYTNGGLSFKEHFLFRESYAPATEEVAFIDVPNNWNDYLIKLCMTDQNGNQVSHLYTIEIQTDLMDIQHLNVINKGVFKDSWGELIPRLLIVDSSGNENTKDCAEKCIVDGVRYSNPEDIIANISLNTFYKIYENEDGEIAVISQYDKIYGEFSDIVCGNNTLQGNINIFQATEQFDLIIALYNGDILIDVLSFSEPSNVASQSFEFTVDTNEDYNLKAFFLDKETMTPLGDTAYN